MVLRIATISLFIISCIVTIWIFKRKPKLEISEYYAQLEKDVAKWLATQVCPQCGSEDIVKINEGRFWKEGNRNTIQLFRPRGVSCNDCGRETPEDIKPSPSTGMWLVRLRP